MNPTVSVYIFKLEITKYHTNKTIAKAASHCSGPVPYLAMCRCWAVLPHWNAMMRGVVYYWLQLSHRASYPPMTSPRRLVWSRMSIVARCTRRHRYSCYRKPARNHTHQLYVSCESNFILSSGVKIGGFLSHFNMRLGNWLVFNSFVISWSQRNFKWSNGWPSQWFSAWLW